MALWLWWVAAHIAAFVLIKGVGDSRTVMSLPHRARTVAKAAVVGGSVAVAQYLVLDWMVPWADAWAVFTLAGWTVGFCVGESFVRNRPVGQFIFGAIVGAAQAQVLTGPSGAWVAAAWFAISTLSIGGTDTALKHAIRRRGVSVGLSVLMLGVVIGGTSGILLRWIVPP